MLARRPCAGGAVRRPLHRCPLTARGPRSAYSTPHVQPVPSRQLSRPPGAADNAEEAAAPAPDRVDLKPLLREVGQCAQLEALAQLQDKASGQLTDQEHTALFSAAVLAQLAALVQRSPALLDGEGRSAAAVRPGLTLAAHALASYLSDPRMTFGVPFAHRPRSVKLWRPCTGAARTWCFCRLAAAASPWPSCTRC